METVSFPVYKMAQAKHFSSTVGFKSHRLEKTSTYLKMLYATVSINFRRKIVSFPTYERVQAEHFGAPWFSISTNWKYLKNYSTLTLQGSLLFS